MTSVRSALLLGCLAMFVAILGVPSLSFAQVSVFHHDCTAGFAGIHPTDLSRRRMSLDARLLGLGPRLRRLLLGSGNVG